MPRTAPETTRASIGEESEEISDLRNPSLKLGSGGGERKVRRARNSPLGSLRIPRQRAAGGVNR